MRPLLLGMVLFLLTGCASSQLRRHTLNQVQTVADLQYQQVLDNLAMFVSNPQAMPFFSVPGAGGTSISTTGQASNSITWNIAGFASDALTLGASRTNGGTWTLAPINDPAKLERMRCAYQIAVGYLPDSSVNDCTQCCKLIERWYPDAAGNCGVPCRVPAPGWFSVGCKQDVPKHICLIGNYCDVWVWVDPSSMEELTRLTLTILDFATAASGYVGPPAVPPAKQQVVRRWSPVYENEKVIGYNLIEVTTTTEELQSQGGVPFGLPPSKATGPLVQSAEATTIVPQNQMFDRPRENYFNPILPQLQLFRNP